MKTTRLIGCKCKYGDIFSLAILIGRGLDKVILVLKSILVQFNVKVGGTGDEDPPVPIPNTEVKLIYADNTWWETAWEDR